MKIIAFANQKGGVGKTTSTYNIAWLKAKDGANVLMVDLNPQASLTIACGMRPGEAKLSICDLLGSQADPYDCGYPVGGKAGLDDQLNIIPSDIELAVTEQQLTGRIAREQILARQLQKFEHEFDYIFLDCPPQLGILTTNALTAADEVIIPVEAEYLAYRGLRALHETIDVVRRELNSRLMVKGCIVTKYRKVLSDQRAMLSRIEDDGENILGIVKLSGDAVRSEMDGVPVVMSNKSSDVAKAYVEIAAKI